MVNYRWSCHVCATGNAPEVKQCVACGAPAVASGRDIARVAKARATQGATNSPLVETVAPWRVAIAAAAVLVVLAGIGLIFFSPPSWSPLSGFAVLGAGAAVLWWLRPPRKQLTIAFESPDQPEVHQLMLALDNYQYGLYPPGNRRAYDVHAMLKPEVRFAVVRASIRTSLRTTSTASAGNRGTAIATGAIVLSLDDQPPVAELKRFYVTTDWRRRGVARALLAWLEAEAVQAGCKLMRLETGTLQPEAIRLYEQAGYVRRSPFGATADDPYSLFMHKPLQ